MAAALIPVTGIAAQADSDDAANARSRPFPSVAEEAPNQADYTFTYDIGNQTASKMTVKQTDSNGRGYGTFDIEPGQSRRFYSVINLNSGKPTSVMYLVHRTDWPQNTSFLITQTGLDNATGDEEAMNFSSADAAGNRTSAFNVSATWSYGENPHHHDPFRSERKVQIGITRSPEEVFSQPHSVARRRQPLFP